MAQQKFPQAGDYTKDTEDFLRRVASNLKGVMKAKLNNTGIDSFTLTINVATTDVALSNGDLTPTTVIHLMPITAAAAVELASGATYVSSINAASTTVGGLAAFTFRVTHTNSATAGRTFKFSLHG